MRMCRIIRTSEGLVTWPATDMLPSASGTKEDATKEEWLATVFETYAVFNIE